MIARHAVVLGALAVATAGAPLDTVRAQNPSGVRETRTQTRPGAVVRGRVIDVASGRALDGATVRIDGPASDTLRIDTLRTDTRGAWRSSALTGGRYRLFVRALGYIPREMTLDVAGDSAIEQTIALEPAATALDRVVVTASRREQSLKDVPVTTELVTRDEIERTAATDLASVLIEQTGIDLQGGHPAGTGVMLQGIGSERVLILLDGQPLAGRISGVFDVSRIPTTMIERIEVVKGPQSTLYGSEAMGGVVNIITREPRRGVLGANAMVTAGTQGRMDGTVGLTLGRGAFASTADVSRRETETTPGRSDDNGALAARTDASVKVRWTRPTTSSNATSVEASMLALDERQRWRSGTLYNFSDNVQWSGRVGGTMQRGSHRLTSTLFGSNFDHVSRGSSQPKPIAGDTGDRQIQRIYQGELTYNAVLGTALARALDVGIQVRRDETESARVPGGLRTLTSYEPFAQLELEPVASLSVVPGVRVSRNSQWGTHVTPRLAARYTATDRLTLRASAGTGYRAPDFKELYMFFVNQGAGYAVFGNPDLRPESSRNITAGAEWASDHVYLRGQAFWNEFRDFIETQAISPPDEAPVFEYANIDDGRTQGVELEAGLTARGLRIEGGYSGLATRNHATDQPLLGRPKHTARSTVGYAVPFGARVSLTGVYTGRTPMLRDDATGVVTSWRDGFFRMDARLAQRVMNGLEIVVGADNLFDRQPSEWEGYTRRQFYTALSWSVQRTTDR
jgi:outer membrane receptor for ferrienterochelin and colicins